MSSPLNSALTEDCVKLTGAPTEPWLNASALYNLNSLTISVTSNLIQNTPICTLIDSSSTHCFLDTSITSKHHLCTYNINPIPLWLFNGTTNSIIHSAIDLPVHFPLGDEHSVTFYVTLLDSSCATVLGHNWLTCFNPLIDWVLGSIMFHSPLQTDSLTSPETVASAPISSKLCPLRPHWLLWRFPLSMPQPLPISLRWMILKSTNSSSLTNPLLMTLQLTWRVSPQTTMTSLMFSVKHALAHWPCTSLMTSKSNLKREPLLLLVRYIPFLKVSWNPSGSF